MTQQNSAVSVIEPDEQPIEASVVTWNLDDFPTDRFNRLVPMQSIAIPNDLFKPAYQVILADPPDRDGKSADTYKSTDVPNGHRAPTARFLRKVATAAGITFSDERRLDDGSNPDVMGVTMQASMVLPTGQRVSAPGSQLIDIRTWFKSDSSPAEVAKFRKQFYANVATRAMNRAIRGLLAMRSSYPEAELAKPFLVVSYVPNLNHPEIRARVLDAMAPVTAQLYGPPSSVKQLGSGPDVQAPEAPEEDPGSTESTSSSTAPEEPDWMKGSAPAKAAEKPDFLVATRAFATEGDDAEELASGEDLATLREVFAFAARNGTLVGAGIQALWPDQQPNALSKGQARAIARAAESLGPEAFEAAWRRVSEQQTASAAA